MCAPTFEQRSQPHVDSFNFHLDIMPTAVSSMHPIRFSIPSQTNAVLHISLRMTSHEVGYPMSLEGDSEQRRTTPRECRELGRTYSGPAKVECEMKIGHERSAVWKSIGDMPVMVRSSRWALICDENHPMAGAISQIWACPRYHTIARYFPCSC